MLSHLLSLTCDARAILIEIARGHDDGTNSGLDSARFREMQYCAGNGRSRVTELQERRCDGSPPHGTD
jgi:hypothetical protein